MKARILAVKRTVASAIRFDRVMDDIKINQGRILSNQQRFESSVRIEDYEFRIFSQWGEDGILQYLTRNLRIRHKTFIEFGVEDFFESTCRFLMMKDLWKGFVIDGSKANIARLQASYFYWRYPLHSKAAFINRENVCDLLEESQLDKELGVLSVDLDGIDYHVLEQLSDWRPAILIVEYNAVFGNDRAVTVPYDPSFQRTKKHYSNLYWGASLPAFCHLAGNRGYGLVGVNSTGSNAFFVRRDLLTEVVRELDSQQGFRDSVFRESRDVRDQLSLLTGAERRRVLGDLPLLDVVSGQRLTVADLDESPPP